MLEFQKNKVCWKISKKHLNTLKSNEREILDLIY